MPQNQTSSQDEAEYAAQFDADMLGTDSNAGAGSNVAASGEPAPAASGEPSENPGSAETNPEVTEGMVEAEPDGDEGASTDEKAQRLQQWEAELQAREAEIASREAATNDDTNQVTGLSGDGKPQEPEPAGRSVDEIVASISEDFGEDFAKMLLELIDARSSEKSDAIANERIGPVWKHIDGLASSIAEENARKHFEDISEDHPDFKELVQSPVFAAFIEQLPEEQRTQAAQIIERGNAKQASKLLSAVKQWASVAMQQQAQAGANPPEDGAAMAAEGVRSRGGMQIPDKPQKSDDYETAWEQF